MSVTQPFFRTVRQLVDGAYAEGGRSQYVKHPQFAVDPAAYIRAYDIIQKDFVSLLEYVDPTDTNLSTYSLRIYALLLRVCTEVETNFKAVMRANTYSKTGNLNVTDYYKVNTSHFLSDYEVIIPYWTGAQGARRPFQAWAGGRGVLDWYDAYNKTKHDRVTNLNQATFLALTDAICGLVVLLSAQFYTYDFSPRDDLLSLAGPNHGSESAIGDFFRVRFPQSVPDSERYDFNWQVLGTTATPFQKFDYDAVKSDAERDDQAVGRTGRTNPLSR